MKDRVMISIRPEWVEKILSGEKTMEIRKSRPMIVCPFKCFIYCTKDPRMDLIRGAETDGKYRVGNGKVVAEFTCDQIERISVPFPAYRNEMDETVIKRSCVRYLDLHHYAGPRNIYGWGISELKIYDEFKSLEEFGMKTAPMSWGYVKENEDE